MDSMRWQLNGVLALQEAAEAYLVSVWLAKRSAAISRPCRCSQRDAAAAINSDLSVVTKH